MRFTQRPAARIRLLCVPHAGGGASAFRSWATGLPAHVDVIVTQRPGRESRLGDRALTSIDAMVEELVPAVDAQPPLPLAIMGHSMGAVVAFELAHALRDCGVASPLHLFVSGSKRPGQRDSLPHMHTMPDAELVSEIDRRFGGIPAAVREHVELMELLVPMLRADIIALETYVRRERRPLDCPITAFAGTHDPRATPEAVREWEVETTRQFTSHAFDGDHFFLAPHREAILSEIVRGLEAALVQRGAA